MIIDSHCHLEFNDNLPEIIRRAQKRNVGLMLNIGTESLDLAPLLGALETYSSLYGAFAIHPHSVEKDKTWVSDEFEGIFSHPKILAVGETGLDYHYNFAPKEIQKKAFFRHIEIAQKKNLPVIVHTREADDDTLSILKESYKIKPFKCLLHSFNSSYRMMQELSELGFYFSFSGMITFKKSDTLREIVKEVPLDKILSETDSPYLAPVPYRGKQNEPSYVVEIFKKIAELKNIKEEELEDIIFQNFKTLFGGKGNFNED
ncbi:MAG: TatD family deoxyribonuclease [Alphaproteobacteria bacterium]|nr:TatD family hydrolase [Alphaproteobacteria bacterium]NCB49098.1 TatD family deoxyribonuclease [Alphaproteobacteria bacterium]